MDERRAAAAAELAACRDELEWHKGQHAAGVARLAAYEEEVGRLKTLVEQLRDAWAAAVPQRAGPAAHPPYY